ncbi:hypothetical protein BT93_B0968 [Corymbia citriodora subsp. variegata]|nr:hypothetical protein BT93_B0968 [Corymbia citriodora subsp. variegata]
MEERWWRRSRCAAFGCGGEGRSSRDQPTEQRVAEAGAAAGGSKGGGWLERRGVGPRSTAGSSWLSPSWLCLSSSDLVSSLPAKLCCIFLLRFGSGSLPLLLLSLSRSTLAGTSKPDYASGNQAATRMGDRARPQARGDRSSRRAGGAVMALSGVRIASDVRGGDDSGASHQKSSSSRRRSDGGAVSDLICRGVGMAER